MRKTPFIITILAALLMAQPIWAAEQAEKEGIEAEAQAVGISVSGSQVRVTNAEGKTLEIYNLAGVRVGQVKIDSEDKTLNLNLPKHAFAFLRREIEDGECTVSVVYASDILKRYTDSVKCAMENDVFGSLPDDSLLDDLEDA